MDKNKPYINAAPAHFIAVLVGGIIFTTTQPFVEHVVAGFLIGTVLGVLVGSMVFWLTPFKRPLSPQRCWLWAFVLMLALELMLALTAFWRGGLISAVMIMCMGGFQLLLHCWIWKQSVSPCKSA